MAHAVIDPKTTNSVKQTDTAFNMAYNTTDDFWTWLERPGNEKHNATFTLSMGENGRMGNEQSILEGNNMAIIIEDMLTPCSK